VGISGLGLALVSLPLAAVAGPPYLKLDSVNPWLVVFAIGLFTALFALPFLFESRARATRGGGEERWERALLAWGAVTVALLVLAIAVGLATDFSSNSLFGSVALVTVGESVLVLGTLVVWMLSG
jgi:hypothetical protein